MQDFKNIVAWQRGHALSIVMHRTCSGFTRAGHANLRSQLTRAAESIAANIVEGCGSRTRKEFARYLDIAIKSANETEHHLMTARDLNLISPEDWYRLTTETITVRKMIFGYRRKVLEADGQLKAAVHASTASEPLTHPQPSTRYSQPETGPAIDVAISNHSAGGHSV